MTIWNTTKEEKIIVFLLSHKHIEKNKFLYQGRQLSINDNVYLLSIVIERTTVKPNKDLEHLANQTFGMTEYLM
jgi:hypothetical protein